MQTPQKSYVLWVVDSSAVQFQYRLATIHCAQKERSHEMQANMNINNSTLVAISLLTEVNFISFHFCTIVVFILYFVFPFTSSLRSLSVTFILFYFFMCLFTNRKKNCLRNRQERKKEMRLKLPVNRRVHYKILTFIVCVTTHSYITPTCRRRYKTERLAFAHTVCDQR